MIAWCGEHGFDLCLIETMPMGEIDGDRTDAVSAAVAGALHACAGAGRCTETDYGTGGPARYYTVAETGPAPRLHHADDA